MPSDGHTDAIRHPDLRCLFHAEEKTGVGSEEVHSYDDMDIVVCENTRDTVLERSGSHCKVCREHAQHLISNKGWKRVDRQKKLVTDGGREQQTEGIKQWVNDIHEGDAFDILPKLPCESVHAVVTDPPYGLAFMGRSWDEFEPQEYQEFCEEWAAECKRVLKPGGHLLAFSGNRTHHRMFSGVEDAGFEIRDTLTWHYGSGFPKASDISKTIDKRKNAEREVVGEDPHAANRVADIGYHGDVPNEGRRKITEPESELAKKWDGWRTGLKPATEFVVMARKSFEGAAVDAVINHGTGALNIDGCRIDYGTDEVGDNRQQQSVSGKGRYPSNVVFDEAAAEELDRKVGDLEAPGSKGTRESYADSGVCYGDGLGTQQGNVYLDQGGGPSRYFYTSKASSAERTNDGAIDNNHPTVKPTDLMEWLVTMVTRDNQIVLDPFAGSGTTCMAAKALGRRFLGIERQPEYVSLAQARAGVTVDNPDHLLEDGETSLGAFTDGGQND